MKKSDYLFLLLLGVVVGAIFFILMRGYKHPFSSSDVTIIDLNTTRLIQKSLPGPDSVKPEGQTSTENKNGKGEIYIIIGSFKTLKEAQQLAGKMKKGTNTDIIVLPGTADGYYRVSYGRYSTLEEARSIIKSIRTNIKSDAWLLTVNRKS